MVQNKGAIKPSFFSVLSHEEAHVKDKTNALLRDINVIGSEFCFTHTAITVINLCGNVRLVVAKVNTVWTFTTGNILVQKVEICVGLLKETITVYKRCYNIYQINGCIRNTMAACGNVATGLLLRLCWPVHFLSCLRPFDAYHH